MEHPVKTVIITQARTGSTRLPGKVLMKINDQELLAIHLERLAKSKQADQVIVATTTNEEDVLIETLSTNLGYTVYRGSEGDVLDRFYQSCKNLQPEWVVRVTSDCPLIDAELIDAVIRQATESDVDYCSNTLIENYPDGQDIEVFKFSALEKAWSEARLNSEREHVTPFIRTNCDFKGGTVFKAGNFPCPGDYSKIRMTVDEQKDFDLIEKLISEIGTDRSWMEYTQYIIDHQLYRINSDIERNEGYYKSVRKD